ncbi:MAG: SUMF1/EgtB/PvdO family nonheme iron enzyme, partial [Elusimicrobia bacterium]|nr:SUMF1/EgtB/PvdO family nonheme iron enzyme [Elusimicrobiota bacterium]
MRKRFIRRLAMPVSLAVCAAWAPPAGAQQWPDLSAPARAVGGGEQDAAVVVGIEGYAFVPEVAGAEANARAWYDYFARTRGIPVGRVKLLTGVDATREEMLGAVRGAAAGAGPEGTLWFVFVGHGAPSRNGKDGLLVGVDAQQKAATIQARSLTRSDLLGALGQSKAGAIRVILDACFSGRREDGSSIAPGLQPLVTVSLPAFADPRMVVLTAAKGNQFAGALPGVRRPAFSYLVLGGLRGWAGKAQVTAGSLWRYATEALEATLRGRDQTPELSGKETALMAPSAGESGPDLAALAKATAGGSAREEMFKISSLPEIPRITTLNSIGQLTSGLDFRDIDIPAMEKYDKAVRLDESDALPEEKIRGWQGLAEISRFSDIAGKRAKQWERYIEERKAAEEARRLRMEACDNDWEKLARLLPLKVIAETDKKRWSEMFVKAYGKAYDDNPYIAELAPFLPPGTVKVTAGSKAPPVRRGKAGIEWVTIPGGTFAMGADDWSDTKPRHSVTVRTFQLAKTEVTNKQYRACVEAGACTPPSSYNGGDDHPVVYVDWRQAKAFAEWAGGRLPSEAEWEYAARSAGKERKYPWGDEEPSCERA